MATAQNSNINYTQLVQKYIGTAYDKVARVTDSINGVDLIAQTIEDGVFQYIVDNIDAITTVVEDIYAFKGIYYGLFDTHPLMDPFGNPMDLGDMYYNTIDNQLYIYAGTEVDDGCGNIVVIDEKWLPVGAITNTEELQVMISDNITTHIVNLRHPYIPGNNNVAVYVNNIRQYSNSTDSIRGSYREVNGSTITFIPGRIMDGHNKERNLEVGDEVLIVVGVEVSTVNHQVQVEMGRYITQVANEQLITLPLSDQSPGGMEYVMGSHNLEVYVKTNQHTRELQMLTIDYLEITPNSIQFIVPLPQYAEIIFKKGNIISNIAATPYTLMMEAAPTETYYDEGQLWYNTATGRLSVLYRDNDMCQWVDVSEEHTVIHQDYTPPPAPPPVLTNATIFQPIQPEPDLFAEGTFWFNTGTGELNVLYHDEGDQNRGASVQWVKVSTQ